MGSAQSSDSSCFCFGETLEEKVSNFIPAWCERNVKLNQDIADRVAQSWFALKNGETKPFKEAKEKHPKLNPVSFFYNTFYNSLFEQCPQTRGLFHRGKSSQGKMFANILNFIVISCQEGNENQFRQALRHVAVTHNQKKIPAAYYSVMGKILIEALKKCCGEEDIFDMETERAWILVWSYMLELMLPIVVRNDQKINEAELEEYNNLCKKKTTTKRPRRNVSMLSSSAKSDSSQGTASPATRAQRSGTGTLADLKLNTMSSSDETEIALIDHNEIDHTDIDLVETPLHLKEKTVG